MIEQNWERKGSNSYLTQWNCDVASMAYNKEFITVTKPPETIIVSHDHKDFTHITVGKHVSSRIDTKSGKDSFRT